MNSSKYLPFERNNYFKGKLLNVDSFETEQHYFNSKRRLSNGYITGSGVLCGLDVVELEDDCISIEAGIAIDVLGREIVVPEPEFKRLPAIDGYNAGLDDTSYYLCIGYDERSKDRVRTDSGESGSKAYDKISEVYNIYLLDFCPENMLKTPVDYYRFRDPVCQTRDVQIYLEVPKFIKAGERFLINVVIIPELDDMLLNIDFTIFIKCARYGGTDRIHVKLDSRSERTVNGVYELPFVCEAMNVTLDVAEFEVREQAFKGTANNKALKCNELHLESVMTDDDPYFIACERLRMNIMADRERAGFTDVCIAKLVIREGRLQRIIDFPFDSRIYTNSRLAIENYYLKQRLAVIENSGNRMIDPAKEREPANDQLEIASGEVEIELGVGGKIGKRFFSPEISHELGLGDVFVTAGVKSESGAQSIIYGSSEIFDQNNDKTVKAEVAVKTNISKGTFVIGLRLTEATSQYRVKIVWTAIKRREQYAESPERKIVLNCGARSLEVMRSAYFTVKFVNMPESELIWSVDSDDGGTINESGLYTAPNHGGVFKITARCAEDPSVSASAYVIVKP